jgi:hypothetical protein
VREDGYRRTYEPADADDGDLLAGAGAVAHEGRVGGEARAEHGRGRLGRERVRDREYVELVGDNSGRVAALGRDAVGVVIGLSGVLEKVEQVGEDAGRIDGTDEKGRVRERDGQGRTGHNTHVGVDLLRAVVLVLIRAELAGVAARDLGADADAVADLDAGVDLGADAGRDADDLVAGDDGWGKLAPAVVEGVDV